MEGGYDGSSRDDHGEEDSVSDAERMMQLFERLPEAARGELIDFAEFLARKADPVAWALDTAPEDDEPLTDEDVAAIEAARASIAKNGTITQAQLDAELGL